MWAASGAISLTRMWWWLAGIPVGAGLHYLASGWGIEMILPDHPILDPVLDGVLFTIAAFVSVSTGTFFFRLVNAPVALDRERRRTIKSATERIEQLEQALRPLMHLEFDAKKHGCMHQALLNDGTTGLCVRILPVCDTLTGMGQCEGHLNGVYRRASENDKWQPTVLDERLSLSWANRGFGAITFSSGLLQYLDLLTINNRYEIFPFIHAFPPRAIHVFVPDDFYRFDIVVTGDQNNTCSLSLQLHRTDSWVQPHIRILRKDELDIAEL
jgi:hypothetical protein